MPLEISTRNKIVAWSVLILTVLILETIFFRSIIFHTDNIAGDLVDSRLVSLIMEHWYKVFCGKEAIRDLSMFYPVKNTLGYSDALFLLSLPYSVFRALGISWLSAYQLTLIIIHLFGGICLAWLLRKTLKFPLWACIIGLIIGNFSNSYFVKFLHTQFVTYSLVPLLFIFLKNFYDCFNPAFQKKRMLYGILSIFLFAGILLTGFYVGLFSVFFFLTVNIVIVIYFLKNNKEEFRKTPEIIKTCKIEILTYIITGIIALLPFLWIYIPIYKEMGRRNISTVLYYLPNWYDFFNVSPQNLIWPFPSEIYELQVGFPLITGLLLIIGCIFFIKQSTANSLFVEKKEMRFYITFGFSLAIAIISLLILKINMSQIVGLLDKTGIIKMKQIVGIANKMGIGSQDIENKIMGRIGISLWLLVWLFIPGASAIRAVSRFNQFLSFPAGIVIAYFLSDLIRAVNKKNIKYAIYIILPLVIFAEHQNTKEISYWTKSQINVYLEKVSAPPDDCVSFLLINDTAGYLNDIYHLNAWTIANKYNIKTINGYSGQFPKSWNYIKDMDSNKNYREILRWIDEYDLKNVYLYDYENDNWVYCTESAFLDLNKQI